MIRLQLSVEVKNAKGENSFFLGEPVYLTVQLINQTAKDHYDKSREQAKKDIVESMLLQDKKIEQKDYITPEGIVIRLPRRAYGWAGEVDVDLYSREERGEARREVFPKLDWTKLLVSRRAVLEAIVEIGARPVMATWCIPPEYTSQLAAGRYDVTVRYDTTGINNVRTVRGDLVRAASFNILKPPEKGKAEVQVPYEQAKYYLKAKKPDEAIKYAKKALAIDAKHDMHLGYCHLGRAYEEKGMLKEAISAYEEFLKHHGDSKVWGYPATIKTRVEILRQKLKR